jgi:hypothetical protein
MAWREERKKKWLSKIASAVGPIFVVTDKSPVLYEVQVKGEREVFKTSRHKNGFVHRF